MLISSHSEVYEKLLLFVVALLLSSMELFIPRIPLLPWLKPGFANIVTIIWLLRFGYRDTLLFGLLRIWLTAFFFGFSFFTGVLALTGMVTAVSAMALLVKFNRIKPLFGFVGVGLAGALFHNFGQLSMLKLLIGEASLVSVQLPLMVFVGMITGTITGIFAGKFANIDHEEGAVLFDEIDVVSVHIAKKILSLFLLGAMIAVLWITQLSHSILFMLSSLLVSLLITRSLKESLKSVSRFWFFLITVFLVTAFTNGFNWSDAGIHLFRLWGWLQCTVIFRYLQSDRLLFGFLHRIFPRRESTLSSALIAIEVFPELIKNGVFKAVGHPKELLTNPGSFLESLITMSHEVLEEGGWGKRH